MSTLRSRKKERTRAHVAAAAHHLFLDRGYDAVTIAEVAHEAEVGVATVYHHFATKEDLYFSGLDDYLSEVVDAVRDRPAGTGVVTAFADALGGPGAMLTDLADGGPDALARARRIHRVVADSPALQDRETRLAAAAADRLTAVLALEEGVDPDVDPAPAAVAAALLGAHRALLVMVRRRVLSGDRTEHLAADVATGAAAMWERLRRGWGQ